MNGNGRTNREKVKYARMNSAKHAHVDAFRGLMPRKAAALLKTVDSLPLFRPVEILWETCGKRLLAVTRAALAHLRIRSRHTAQALGHTSRARGLAPVSSLR